MSLIKEHNGGFRKSIDEARLKSIKPVMFEYAHAQKQGDFDEVSYDYIDDVNKMRGKSVVECSQISFSCLTKTDVQRESDDSPNENLMISVTKTAIQREDDETQGNELAYAITKTLAARESDDDTSSYLPLLTKTEEARKTDE